MRYADMTEYELRVELGNMMYQLWSKLDEPKSDYNDWYYGRRVQSFSDIESCPRRCIMEQVNEQA